MKYFTKEFYTLQQLSYAYDYVTKSKFAEKKDEDFYKKCYEKKYALFFRFEKGCDWYIDPAEELHKIQKYAAEPNVSPEEHKRRLLDYEMYLAVNRQRIQNKQFYKIDKELCKRKFAEKHRELIELYSQLPKEITDKIADIRVFALGYASEEVKKLLRPYCNNLKKTIEKTTYNARIENDLAEDNLAKPVYLNDLDICSIMKIKKINGDVYLELEDINLLIKNGKITEGLNKPVFPYQNKPDCPWSRVLYPELHFKEGIFELCFLISNLDATEKEDLWYLTICGTDIIEII